MKKITIGTIATICGIPAAAALTTTCIALIPSKQDSNKFDLFYEPTAETTGIQVTYPQTIDADATNVTIICKNNTTNRIRLCASICDSNGNLLTMIIKANVDVGLSNMFTISFFPWGVKTNPLFLVITKE